jgi:hypothetical protein
MSLLLLFNQRTVYSKNFTDTITISDNQSVQNTFNRSISENITLTDNIELNRILVRIIIDSFTFMDSIEKSTTKYLVESFLSSDELLKSISKHESDSVIFIDSYGKIQGKEFLDTLLLTDVVSKNIELVKNDSITFIDYVYEYINRILVIISRIFGRTLNMSSLIYGNLNIDSSITSDTSTIVNDTELDTMTIQSTITRNLTFKISIG